MKHLYIFIGPPAGGKTTIAKSLANSLDNSQVIEVGKIKEKVSGSVFAKNDDERELWFLEINKSINKALKSYRFVIIDEGFFAKVYLEKILRDLDSIPRTIVKIMFSLEEHLKRDSSRHDGGDSKSVEKNYKNFIYSHGEDEIVPDVTISDPHLSTEEIVGRVLNHK